MCFIVIETLGGAEYATIVTDIEGNNLVFDTREEAEQEAADCQDGLVVEIQLQKALSPAVAPQQAGVAAARNVLIRLCYLFEILVIIVLAHLW